MGTDASDGPSLLILMGTILSDDELSSVFLASFASDNATGAAGRSPNRVPPGLSRETAPATQHAYITCIDASTSGMLAVGSSQGGLWVLRVSFEGTATVLAPALRLRRVDEAEEASTTTALSYPATIKWSPCGSFIAVGTSRGNLLVFEVALGRLRLSVSQQLHQYHPVTAIAWSPDSSKVFSGCARGKVVELVVKSSSDMGTFAFAASLFRMNSTRVLLNTGQPIMQLINCTSRENQTSEVTKDIISVCSGDLLVACTSPRGSGGSSSSLPPTVYELSRGARGLCWCHQDRSASSSSAAAARERGGSKARKESELFVSLDPDSFMQDADIKNLGSVFTVFDLSMNVPLTTFLCAEGCDLEGNAPKSPIVKSGLLRDASSLNNDAQSFRNLHLIGNEGSTAIGITWDNKLGLVDFKSKLYYVLDALQDVVSISVVNNDIYVLHRIMMSAADGSSDWKHAIHVMSAVGHVSISHTSPASIKERPDVATYPQMRFCPVVNYLWLSYLCKLQRLYRGYRERRQRALEQQSSTSSSAADQQLSLTPPFSTAGTSAPSEGGKRLSLGTSPGSSYTFSSLFQEIGADRVLPFSPDTASEPVELQEASLSATVDEPDLNATMSDIWINNWKNTDRNVASDSSTVRQRLHNRRSKRSACEIVQKTPEELEFELFGNLKADVEAKRTFAVKLPLYSSCGAGIKFQLRDDGLLHVIGFSRPILDEINSLRGVTATSRSYAEACGLIELGDILVEMDDVKMEQLSIQTTIQKLQELVIDSAKREYVTMRFRYGDPKISTDRSNGEKADAEDSKRAEGDEVLLNSVLTPLSTDETHTIATESKERKPAKKSKTRDASISDPYLLDMGMMFASYIPEVHLAAIEEEYGYSISPARSESTWNDAGGLSPVPGERIEDWSLGTEDVFDFVYDETCESTPEFRKVLAAKWALYPCAALFSVDKGLFEDVLISDPERALSLATNELEYWKLLHFRASITGFYREGAPPLLSNKLYYVPLKMRNSSTGDAFLGMLRDWSTEEERFQNKRSRANWFKLETSDAANFDDERILDEVSKAISIEFDLSDRGLRDELQAMEILKSDISRMIDKAKSDRSLIPNVMFSYTTFVTRLAELSEIHHQMQTIQVPYRQRSRSESQEDDDADSETSSDDESSAIESDSEEEAAEVALPIDDVLSDGILWQPGEVICEPSIMASSIPASSSDSIEFSKWDERLSLYVDDWRDCHKDICNQILSSLDPISSLSEWAKLMVDTSVTDFPSNFIDVVIMFSIALSELSSLSLTWVSRDVDPINHSIIASLCNYVCEGSMKFVGKKCTDSSFAVLQSRLRTLGFIFQNCPSSLLSLDDPSASEAYVSVLFNMGIEISSEAKENYVDICAAMLLLIDELSNICADLPFDTLLAAAIACGDLHCIELVVSRFNEVYPSIVGSSASLLDHMNGSTFEDSIAAVRSVRSYIESLSPIAMSCWLCPLYSILISLLSEIVSNAESDDVKMHQLVLLFCNLRSVVPMRVVRSLVYVQLKEQDRADQFYFNYLSKLSVTGTPESYREFFRLRLQLCGRTPEETINRVDSDASTSSARKHCCLGWGAARETEMGRPCRCRWQQPAVDIAPPAIASSLSSKALMKRASFAIPKASVAEEPPSPRSAAAVLVPGDIIGYRIDNMTSEAFAAALGTGQAHEVSPEFVIESCIASNRPNFLFTYVYSLLSSLISGSWGARIGPSSMLARASRALNASLYDNNDGRNEVKPLRLYQQALYGRPGDDRDLIDVMTSACEEALCAVVKSFGLSRSATAIDPNGMVCMDVCDECTQSLCAIKMGHELLIALYAQASRVPYDFLPPLLERALQGLPVVCISECQRVILDWCSASERADSSSAAYKFAPLTRRTTM